MARSARGVSSSDDLQGFLDTWHAYLAKTSSFWIHGAHILPRTGVFLVRGPFGNASEHNLAIARHRGTHFASILPPPNSRERVEDMCAYPNASVDAAAVEEPGGDGGVGAAGPWGLRNRGWGGVGAPSVERGNRRPQACAAAGRDGGRGPSAAGNTGCGANCTARGLMNPFTPTFPRYGAVIEIICYVTNK